MQLLIVIAILGIIAAIVTSNIHSIFGHGGNITESINVTMVQNGDISDK